METLLRANVPEYSGKASPSDRNNGKLEYTYAGGLPGIDGEYPLSWIPCCFSVVFLFAFWKGGSYETSPSNGSLGVYLRIPIFIIIYF